MALLVNIAKTWLHRLRSTSSQRLVKALSAQIDSICLLISLLLYSSYTDKKLKCLKYKILLSMSIQISLSKEDEGGDNKFMFVFFINILGLLTH